MKKQVLILLVTTLTFLSMHAQKPAYLLYNSDGKKTKYEKMLRSLEDADIIFFGELHTDPIAHWLQYELTKALFNAKRDALILGAEMFEADNQLILNEYLAGFYEASKYEAEMRLWNNYETDYKPLVEFAKIHQVPFIATNIPRRYASMVHKGGFEALDTLSDEAKRYIAPLPILYDPEVKCYKDMLEMFAPKEMGNPKEKEDPEQMENPPSGAHGHDMPAFSMENLPKAQAAKDATMAHFIMENWSEGLCMLHINGSYHSNNHEGIVWHIKQQNADLKIMTINTVLQKEIDALSDENLNTADFIICVPESMTRTSR